MIDFHTHILAGIDDGSRSLEESLHMLRMEAEQGITDVILTPHFYAHENSPVQFLSKRQKAWEKLQPHLTDDLPKLHLGAEVLYFEGICSVKELDDFRVQGTDLLLLEMPMCRWTQRMLEDILEINDRPDTQVLLAHIERYLSLQPKDTLDLLLREGVLIQSNISFFVNWKTRFKALNMLKKKKIHVIGSDCHSTGSRCPNWDQLPKKAKEFIYKNNVYYDLNTVFSDMI